MKLYTEKELRKAMTLMANIHSIYDEVFEQIVPIELPSDDEINKKSFEYYDDDFWAKLRFKKGAIWMKEQILNQNK